MSQQRAGTPSYAVLSHREAETVRAFADVFIAGVSEVLTPEEVTANVDRYLSQVRSNRTRSLRLILFLIEHILPRLSIWPFRPSFSRLSPARRRQLIEQTLQNPRLPRLFRDLAKVKALFLIGYYGDARVHPSLGLLPVDKRPKYGLDLLQPLGLPTLELTEPGTTILTCDICVIGSGAGGAVVAFNAAQQGKDVILIEEGDYVSSRDIVHDEAVMMPRIYKEGGLQSTVDLDTTILQGKALGGTTMLNNAICFRLDDPGITPDSGPDLLQRWAALGAHIDREALSAAYDRVEQMIGVGPLLEVQEPGLPPIDGRNAELLLDGWQRLLAADNNLRQYKSGLFHKNLDRCLGCGYCNFGCPYERKLSTLETYIPAAITMGARVIVGCHAQRIDTGDGHAHGVDCQLQDGRSLRINAGKVVVSAGAIGSSVLLLKSGIKRNVGTRFSFNAGLPVFARFSEPVHAWDGVQMAAYVDGRDYLIETLFYPPMALAAPMPGWFETHFQRMRAYSHTACAGVLVGTEANGRVKQNSLARSIFGPVDYRMTPGDLRKLKAGIALTAEIFFAAGAESVYPASFVPCELTADRFAGNPQDILPFLDEHIRQPDDLTLGSAHPQGGNPISDNPELGAVDSRLRVHGFKNLYVVDASVFPTTIRINPQLTIMALADYWSRLELSKIIKSNTIIQGGLTST